MLKIKRILLLAIPAILLPFVFLYDVIRNVVEFDSTSLSLLRELFLIVSFGSIGLFIEKRRKELLHNAPKEIGGVLLMSFISLLAVCIGVIARRSIPSVQGSLSIAQSMLVMFTTTLMAVTAAVLSLSLLFIIRDLVLFKRRKSTRGNYSIFLVLLILTCVVNLPILKLGDSFLNPLLFSLTVVMIVVNSFKQNWIVYLAKREKIYSIIYSVLLITVLSILDFYLTRESGGNKNLLAYSRYLHTFMQINIIFGTIYFGITFISTLFHLPTAEVFERKQSELNSLHDLSRLVTQVLDFNDLLKTVMQMTMEVSDARSVWLELFSVDSETGEISAEVAAKRNITTEEIELIASNDGTQLRRFILDTNKVLLIEDIWSDKRTKYLKHHNFARGSLLAVPLLSHGKLIGVLHAIKDYQNAFYKDDIDVMTTFADHVSLAIENSRLITKSIERERLHQEIMVAQRMQKRLLPQSLPVLSSVEFAAASESSLEVGGDYYDFITLPDKKIAFVIADVSGKGVSAAFYMAEVKGTILSLSKVCANPKELLLLANETLRESLEKNSFISAIYGVIDTRDAVLTLARAGHCPAVYISNRNVELVRPNGLGLGLTGNLQFDQAIEERIIKLKKGDICIFYTDGITEARNAEMEEYGYERLIQIAGECWNYSAEELKDRILYEVRTFIGKETYNDDVTLVVVKWLGNS